MATDSSDDKPPSSRDASDLSDADHEGQGASAFAERSRSPQEELRAEENVKSERGGHARARRFFQEPDAMVKVCEAQSGERQPISKQNRQGQSRSRQTSRRRGVWQSSRRSQSSQSTKGLACALTTEYRDLLNDMIAEANGHGAGRDHGMNDTQIGASLWSAVEKNAFFHALDRYGTGDLQNLTRAVCSKSQYEIQIYLNLLRADQSGKPQTKIGVSALPSATEVSAECCQVLDCAADQLSARVEEQEQSAERDRFGEDWLLDFATAEAQEEAYQEAIRADQKSTIDVSTVETVDPTSSDQSFLLRQIAFLRLSRDLFMNSGEREASNWQHVDRVTDVCNEPAIFRRAFGDIEAAVISLTRRLVQASIFQAMTRLRASDSTRSEWTPLAAVREIDVRSALEVLGLRPNWRQYWASVARRCRVSVYSDSKKYDDGRPGTKAGHALTFEEVEAELSKMRDASEPDADDMDEEVLDADVDQLMADSDAFTDDDEPMQGAEEDGATRQLDLDPSTAKTRKRKRALSPDSLARVEEVYADKLDLQQSAREETQLWQIVRQEPPSDLQAIQATRASSRPVRAVAADIEHSPDWRELLDYQAEWELESGQPRLLDFRKSEIRGRSLRKRRHIIEQRVRERIQPRQGTGSNIDEGVAASEHLESEAGSAEKFSMADEEPETPDVDVQDYAVVRK